MESDRKELTLPGVGQDQGGCGSGPGWEIGTLPFSA